MGLQVESLGQSSFEQYGPWHFHDIRFKRDEPVSLDTALLQVSSIPGLNDRLSELSKSGKEQLQGAFKGVGPTSPILPPVKSKSASSSSLDPKLSTPVPSSILLTTTTPPVPKIACAEPTGTEATVSAYPVREPSPAPRPSLKRRRPDTDVDGPDTSTLSVKKRRLLRHLITSRLSEPFSLPATHILNRESVASGDRRFLKLATILAARRMVYPGTQNLQSHPSPSSLLRRQAVINRFRLRHQIQVQSVPRVDSEADELSRGSTLRQIFTAPSQQGPNPAYGPPPPPPTPMPRNPGGHTILERAGIAVQPSPPESSSARRPLPSPRLKPILSPELRTSKPAIELVDLDDLDDEDTAFPSSEHESRYEDDPDDAGVYTDFSLIFGGGSEGDLSDEDNFEDVMDDLDGIPWNARC
ncbi:hypothetical protein V8F33_008714 [Rhypophila sp. PSN 637]